MLFSKPTLLIKMLLCCASIYFLNVAQTHGQSFSANIIGTVIDENHLHLPFTQITLKRSVDSVTVKTTVSDEKGSFKFTVENNGRYYVEARMISYIKAYSKTFNVLSRENINLGFIQLKPEVRNLKDVRIIGIRPFIERRADKLVVNLNGLGAGAPILEIMNQLPGVTVTPDDRLSLNGKPVQVYIDGKASTLSSEALSGMLRGISSSAVEKVELISQPSAKYDANGRGGIINIVRKRKYKDGLNGNVYGGAGKGKYGKVNGGINLNYKGKDYNLLVNTDYNYNQYFNNSIISSVFYNPQGGLNGSSNSTISSVRSNATYTPNLGLDVYLSKKTTLSASVKPGFESLNRNSFSDIQNIDPSGTVMNSHFVNLVDIKSSNFSSGLRLQHQIDTMGREIKADIDYLRYGNYNDQHNHTTNLDDITTLNSDILSLLKQDRVYNIYAFKMDYTHPLGKGKQLEAGIKSSYVSSDNSNMDQRTGVNGIGISEQTDRFGYRENISALYTTYSYSGKKFSYQLGIRGEYTWGKGKAQENAAGFTRRRLQPFPSLHADYQFSKDHSLSLGTNKRIERPDYESLNPLVRVISSSNYRQGNPNLLPVISYNADLIYSYKNALFIGLSYNYSKHDFLSATVPLGNGITSTQPGNADYSRYASVQFAYNKNIVEWWTTSSNVILSKKSFRGYVNDYMLENNGLASLSTTTYNSFLFTKTLSLMLLFSYNGRNLESTITNHAYALLTSGVRKTFMDKKIYFQLDFVDVFKSYKNVYELQSGSVKQLWQNQFETRMVKLHFSYNFGGTIKNTKRSNGAEEEKKRSQLNSN